MVQSLSGVFVSHAAGILADTNLERTLRTLRVSP